MLALISLHLVKNRPIFNSSSGVVEKLLALLKQAWVREMIRTRLDQNQRVDALISNMGGDGNPAAGESVSAVVIGAGTPGLGWGGDKTTQASQVTSGRGGGSGQHRTNLCVIASSNYMHKLCIGDRSVATFTSLIEGQANYAASMGKLAGEDGDYNPINANGSGSYGVYGIRAGNSFEDVMKRQFGYGVKNVRPFDPQLARAEIDAGRPFALQIYTTVPWKPWRGLAEAAKSMSHVVVCDSYYDANTEGGERYFRIVDSNGSATGQDENQTFLEGLPVWVTAESLENATAHGYKTQTRADGKVVDKRIPIAELEREATDRRVRAREATEAGLPVEPPSEYALWYLGRRLELVMMRIIITSDGSTTTCPASEEVRAKNAAQAVANVVPAGAVGGAHFCAEQALIDQPGFLDEDGYTCSQWAGECDGVETPANVLANCKCSCALASPS